MSGDIIHFHSFPGDLADLVIGIWDTYIVGGDSYVCPALPGESQLRSLLEVAYLAGMQMEEARPLSFMLCCTPECEGVQRHEQGGFVKSQVFPPRSEVMWRYGQDSSIEAWAFDKDRPFDVREIRRLAVASNMEASAIWVQFPENAEKSMSIHGLLNFGSSWANARRALAYHYDSLPEALLVRVEGPGQLTVYQGNYSIASLQAGRIQTTLPIADLLGVYPLFKEGRDLLHNEIIPPEHGTSSELYDFGWFAYVNTILAIVNSVKLGGHGGSLIFAGMDCGLVESEFVKIKYRLSPDLDYLRQHFVDSVNMYNQFGSKLMPLYIADEDAQQELLMTESMLKDTQRTLAETCSFVGRLSGTDGALILRTDLSVEGFGAEILLDKAMPVNVHEVKEPLERQEVELDSEQFGMRHRSAMRLCAAVSNLVIFVISQDGGVSLVWNNGGEVCFRSGIRIMNRNMVFA